MLKKNEITKMKKLIEELSWIMTEYSSMDLMKIYNALDSSNVIANGISETIGYKPENPNKHFLTGALPALFLDLNLFKTNDEIALFSEQIIGVKIPRYHKKSKYEIIGHIVCEANSLDDNGLKKIVKALEKIVSDEASKKSIYNKKNSSSSFSWNEVIQALNEDL
ncbi:hypothetical protein ACMGGX_10240 [Enterobacter sp. BNK-29]|uniref:hypothetical protein n=1 Tax=Enterobacter TaxID=547 RepID=UPI0005EF888A|nr:MULTISPECIES: hypothetical protein [Enterobacter]MDU6330497.1 hypothetical protein [Enterobacter hormaechei]KJP66368.1 hypothetical protein SR76_17035 [Enterobacter hormaechei subsp. steigerwaltii]MCK6762387.1 hypothetical protein [Enterobacter bugandensis]MCK7332231.1 hypothetical protein [Enterobacter bugandensis]MCK7390972.1 hypothetical protein [Enterobacter bugandensis]